jgi:hypothetical protein
MRDFIEPFLSINLNQEYDWYLLSRGGKDVNFRVLQARSACNTLKLTFFHDAVEQSLRLIRRYHRGVKRTTDRREINPSSGFLLGKIHATIENEIPIQFHPSTG